MTTVQHDNKEVSNTEHLNQEKKEEKSSINSFLLNIVKEVLEFKAWDSVFKVLLYGFILWALYNLKKVYQFHTSEEWRQVPKYSLYDFWIALVALIGFVAYKHLCQFLFYDLLSKKLDLSKMVTEQDKRNKIETACNWAGSMIYYITSSVGAYIVFKDQYFFPKGLGGNGEPSAMFYNFPAIQDIPYAIPFYMIQFSSHLHTLIDYSLYKLKDAKAWDMFLHHFMAVFLIFFSFLVNNVPVGIIVLYVHDPCDIFVYLNRFVSGIKGTSMKQKAGCYVGFVGSWLFFRLYSYPKIVLSAVYDFVYSASNDEILYSPVLFMAVMLTVLSVLHLYWFMFIIRILLVMLKGKSDYNVYDKKQKKAE